ncbi:MAG: hypothetical protein AAFX76_00760 [Planctomycetota bacterium]
MAFTLIELLVVISMIAVLVGLSFPVLRVTLQSSAVNTAEGQVNNALSGARVYATRYKPFVTARPVGGALRTSSDHGDGFSGAVVVFAPDNTLRIMENDENAWDPNPPGGVPTGWLELMIPGRNGYTPVPDLEDLRMTGRVLALGIVRVGSGNYDVRLVPPPFALRFDRQGTLAEGQDDGGALTAQAWDRFVYVSPDGNGRSIGSGTNAIETTDYDIDDDRPAGTLNAGAFGLDGNQRMPDGRVELPFGAIETVAGVLIVDPEEVPPRFRHPGTGTQTTLGFDRDNLAIYDVNPSAALLHWAAENPTFGRILLFNRYTGQDLTR